jgi:hypothetical protein
MGPWESTTETPLSRSPKFKCSLVHHLVIRHGRMLLYNLSPYIIICGFLGLWRTSPGGGNALATMIASIIWYSSIVKLIDKEKVVAATRAAQAKFLCVARLGCPLTGDSRLSPGERIQRR